MSRVHPLARFTVDSSTPILIGSYDGVACRNIGGHKICEGLRPQSVKGVWRWWLRSFIAGALYASGLHANELDKYTAELTSRLLGSTTYGVSPVELRILSGNDRAFNYTDYRLLMNHQRIVLLGIGRRFRLDENSCRVLTGFTVMIMPRLGSHLESPETELLASTLVSSFVLGCFGKGSRRGLGCFDIRLQRYDYIPSYVGSIIHDFNYGVVPSRENVGELVSRTHEFARKYVSRILGHRCSRETHGIPTIPSIAPGAYRLFYAGINDSSPLRVSVEFSKAVTRQHRSKMIKKSDPLYSKRLAWVLGLPRSQQGRGYLAGVQRRASPFILSVHKKYALLSVFYSADWPPTIRWRGGSGSSIISIKPSNMDGVDVFVNKNQYSLREVVDEALGVLLDAMNNAGYKFREVTIGW